MTFRLQVLLLATAFVLLWNSGFIGAEYALPHAGPVTLMFWRYAILACLLGAFTAFGRAPFWPGAETAGLSALTGILAHGVWLTCVAVALDRGVPAGIVALVVALQPLTTGAVSGLVTGERPSPRQWAGLILGLAGVALAVGVRLEGTGNAEWIGYLLPFGSVVAITVASLLQRRRTLRNKVPNWATDLFYQSLGTMLALLPLAVVLEKLATDWNIRFIAAQGWLVFAVSLGAYGLMWRLIARLDATRVASLFYLGPPVTMVMAWLAFGDRVLPTDLAGLVVTACGVVLVHGFGRTRER